MPHLNDNHHLNDNTSTSTTTTHALTTAITTTTATPPRINHNNLTCQWQQQHHDRACRWQGWGLGHCAQSLKKACLLFPYLLIFIDEQGAVHMTRVSPSSTFSTKASHTYPTTCPWNHTLIGVISVSTFFFHAKHKWHRSWSTLFLCPPTHTPPYAKHETTQTRVWFCVRYLFFVLPHMPNTNNTFVGVVLWSNSFFVVHTCPITCWAWNHTKQGVILCSVSFLHPTTHADHETTLSLVLFCAQILSYPLKVHSWFEGCLLNILYIIKY